MGVFCKKVDLSSTQGALCTVSVFFLFLHFTYLRGGGCVRTKRTPHPASGPGFGAAPANLDPAAASADVAADGDEDDH